LFTFIKHYIPYLKHYRARLLLSFLGMVLVAATTAAMAYLMKPLLDEIFVEKNVETLYALPLVIIAVFALKGLGSFLQAYHMNHIGMDIVRQVRDKMIAHLLSMDMAFFYRYHSGELLSRVTNDTGRIQGAVSMQLATFFRELMTTIGLMGVVIYQSPTLAFLICIIIPAAYFPVQMVSKRLKKISHTSQEKNSELTSNLNEIFSNIEIIKAYSSNKYEAEKFAHTNRGFFDISIKSVRVGELVIPLMELFASISASVVIVVGGQEVINGTMTIGAFFSFLTAMFLAVDPMRRVSVTYSRFQDAIAAHERIGEILHTKPSVKEGAVLLESVARIDFDKCSLSYGETQALKEVSFTLKQGEITAFVGNSGGGKSSIINLILRFFDATQGSVNINGENIQKFTLHSLREQIAIVTQRVYIFNDTIAMNVAYGHEVDENKVILALQKANLYDYVTTLPDGIYTRLSEGGVNLSGGQRQRIAIARALYKQPKVLILDEATSALDNQSEAEIITTIQAISQGMITIMIAHRLKTIDIAQRILVMHKGTLVCEGNKAYLNAHCEHFQKLYQKEDYEA